MSRDRPRVLLILNFESFGSRLFRIAIRTFHFALYDDSILLRLFFLGDVFLFEFFSELYSLFNMDYKSLFTRFLLWNLFFYMVSYVVLSGVSRKSGDKCILLRLCNRFEVNNVALFMKFYNIWWCIGAN